MLTQIAKHSGCIERVKDGERPVIELHLEPGEYVTGVELTEDWWDGRRKTRDWRWTAYVVAPLGEAGSEA